MIILACFFIALLLYSLFSRRLAGTVFTAPMLFAAAGISLYLAGPGARGWVVDEELFLGLTEIGLVLVLFADASRISLRALRSNESLPARLLAIGMPLTIVLGLLAAALMLPGLSFWEAGIVASVLAPTDAGLGEIVVTSPLVPQRIRQALNVEAGLNDGLSVPFLFLFIAVAEAGAHGAGRVLVTYGIQQLGGGVLVGLAIGLGGGWLIREAERREWMDEALQPLARLALPVLCIFAAEPIGGSMFIAAFVAGLANQVGPQSVVERETTYTAESGHLLALLAFYLFGIMAAARWANFTWIVWLYAIVSLTAVRMLPVAWAVRGLRLSRPTVLFMGWFGPRGLASIVLGLVYLAEQANLPGQILIVDAITAAVLLSIFAHGLTALPGIKLYARRVALLDRAAPELTGQVPPAPGEMLPQAGRGITK